MHKIKTIGEQIRDAIVEKYSDGSKRNKTAAMEKAAALIGVSPATLYNRVNDAEQDVNFLEKVENILKIDVSRMKQSQEPDDQSCSGDDTVTYPIPIKNKRRAKLVVPSDADSEDLKLIIRQLNLLESHF